MYISHHVSAASLHMLNNATAANFLFCIYEFLQIDFEKNQFLIKIKLPFSTTNTLQGLKVSVLFMLVTLDIHPS